MYVGAKSRNINIIMLCDKMTNTVSYKLLYLHNRIEVYVAQANITLISI